MRIHFFFRFFFLTLIFLSGGLYAAPLESDFAAAPPATANLSEKSAAYREARFRVIADSCKYLRSPYRSGGADRNGFDCSGFVYRSFYDALGVGLPRDSGSLYLWAERIGIEEALPGDLVFFRTTSRGNISHVGIYLGNGQFIHSASIGRVTGVINSNLNEPYWSGAFAGAGRALPAVDMEISEAR